MQNVMQQLINEAAEKAQVSIAHRGGARMITESGTVSVLLMVIASRGASLARPHYRTTWKLNGKPISANNLINRAA